MDFRLRQQGLFTAEIQPQLFFAKGLVELSVTDAAQPQAIVDQFIFAVAPPKIAFPVVLSRDKVMEAERLFAPAQIAVLAFSWFPHKGIYHHFKRIDLERRDKKAADYVTKSSRSVLLTLQHNKVRRSASQPCALRTPNLKLFKY